MNKRLNALINELGCRNSDFKIETQNIKNKVNTTLNADLQERKIYMKQKLFKMIAIAAVIIVLGATTAFAAINSDILKVFFTGDTSAMQSYVKTPKKSVTDGRFTFTLEQVLASKYQVLVIYSVEGLTTDAVRELMKDDFENIDTISFGPQNDKNKNILGYSFGYLMGELKEKRTPTKRYWEMSSDNILNEKEEDYYIRLNVMKNPQKITVPMKFNIKTLELTLLNPSYGDTNIKMSPLGAILETTSNKTVYFTNVFFRMRNGKINTFNELLNGSSCEVSKGRTKFEALFHKIMNLSDFKSVIVDNIEYDMKDTTKTKTVKIDKQLYPFDIKPVYKEKGLWLPVSEFCDKIGAAMEWDDKTKSAAITYRDSIYVITAGSSVVLKDGKKISLGEGKAFIFDGKLVAPSDIVDNELHMNIHVINLGRDEKKKRIPVKDWVWTIVP